MHDASLDLSPTGALFGQSQDYVWGVVYYGSYTWTIGDPTLSVGITDPLGNPVVADPDQTSINDCGAGCTQVQMWAQASEAGYYALTSTASDPSVNIAAVNYSYLVNDQLVTEVYFNPNCGAPSITSIEVENSLGQLQPTNALQVGGSGYLLIQGACFDSSTQVTVDGTGVQIIGLSGIPGPILYAQYPVASNATVGPQNLYINTDAGTAVTNVTVVQGSPYISEILPDVWPAGRRQRLRSRARVSERLNP
jgi:hypothetical protein